MHIMTVREKVNLFSCDFAISNHLYIMDQEKYWRDIHEHFKHMDIYSSIAKALNLTLEQVHGKDFHRAYNLAVTLLSLMEQYELGEIRLGNLSYHEEM